VQRNWVVNVEANVRVCGEELGLADRSKEAGVEDELRAIRGSAEIEQQS
jgi:hypothetical protein